ncbi:MAG TPA: gamma-glutamyl-gamma-aminobutyrate hydrolase family protein [Chthoniobacteraceae bacterium]|nr:gamma-glutamyl-gamma-aminobutyrate hydrolase family protein [Chthoniobacteraceae bacterium]
MVSWIREKDEKPFASFFASHPGVVLENARHGPVDLENMGGLLLTGGADICAAYLNQPISQEELGLIEEDAEADRDGFEFSALRTALEKGVPILTVCKGTQVLNVALGGTLHLDIPGHDLPEMKLHNVQPLRFAQNPTVRFDRVNSSHHQALNRLGEGLEVEAWCAADGVIEQVRLTNYPYALGVQYHPERDLSYEPLFEQFLGEVERK